MDPWALYMVSDFLITELHPQPLKEGLFPPPPPPHQSLDIAWGFPSRVCMNYVVVAEVWLGEASEVSTRAE